MEHCVSEPGFAPQNSDGPGQQAQRQALAVTFYMHFSAQRQGQVTAIGGSQRDAIDRLFRDGSVACVRQCCDAAAMKPCCTASAALPNVADFKGKMRAM